MQLNQKQFILAIFMTVSLMSLTACTEELTYENQSPNPYYARQWSIDNVKLTCKDPNKCPTNHGALIFKSEVELGLFKIFRCTGVLISPTKVLTAGHCTDSFKPGQNSYFITPSTLSKEKRVVKIKRVLHQEYDEYQNLNIDYGLLELETPLSNISYGALTLDQLKDMAKVSALVVNSKSGSENHLSLDQVDCWQTKNNSLLPAFIHDNFSIFAVKNCKLYSGNSGGAITLEDDLNKILGILQTSTNAKGSARTEDSPDRAGVANARCFNIDGWNNSQINCKSIDNLTRGVMVLMHRKTELIQKIVKLVASKSETIKTEIGTIERSHKILVSPTSRHKTKFFLLPYILCISPTPGSQVPRSIQKYTEDFKTSSYEASFNNREDEFQIKTESPTNTLTGQWSVDLSDRREFVSSTTLNERGLAQIAKEKRPYSECKGDELAQHLKVLEAEISNGLR